MSVMAPQFTLDGRVALVTGAGSGIGAGIARGLAASGAAVGCVDLHAGGIAETVAAIERSGGSALALEADVVDAPSMAEAVSAIEHRFGPLSAAVNCAGVHDTAPAESMSRQQWQRLIDVNLTGVFVSCQAEARAMMAADGGAIVNIGSISAHIANRGLDQVHYNSAKAAVRHLSRSLALEWAEHGIRVNVISPGYTLTPLAKAAEGQTDIKSYLDAIPMKRMAKVAELVGPAIFLLSGASSYCTGSDLVVDGGAILW
jgi:NAD(P)-dependent dehydrogenase (short-subunit alcohol dehydrogenase family)